MNADDLKTRIEKISQDARRPGRSGSQTVKEVIDALDKGELRVCERDGDGWKTHAWIKQAILLYFRCLKSRHMGGSGKHDLFFWDKLPLKRNYKKLGVRCVPPGVARYGSFLGPGTILMPGYVNIGAYVGENSMIDTWATVGSCAQIGKNVHLSGGVGIGGVLEPPQAQPVIVEDGAFIGSRCIVVEGVRVRREAVLGAGVVLTGSTPIIDVRTKQAVTSKGTVPERAVVIPGMIPKHFPAGEYQVPCALIIGTRNSSTDGKTSLNAALRDFAVAV